MSFCRPIFPDNASVQYGPFYSLEQMNDYLLKEISSLKKLTEINK